MKKESDLLRKIETLENKLATLQQEVSLLYREETMGKTKCNRNHYIVDEQTGEILREYNGYYTNVMHDYK